MKKKKIQKNKINEMNQLNHQNNCLRIQTPFPNKKIKTRLLMLFYKSKSLANF